MSLALGRKWSDEEIIWSHRSPNGGIINIFRRPPASSYRISIAPHLNRLSIVPHLDTPHLNRLSIVPHLNRLSLAPHLNRLSILRLPDVCDILTIVIHMVHIS
jgi:hypothetical protein